MKKLKITWQSIETAPKDGTYFIALWKDSKQTATVHYRAWKWEKITEGFVNRPTHWMPLPDAPE